MSRDEAAPRREETPHDRHRDCERRIGHDPKRPLRKAEVTGIDLNNGHGAISKPLPEVSGPDMVKFHGNDFGPSCDQRCRECARAGTDVENEVSGPDTGVGDDRVGPTLIEPVPSPQWPRLPGHGAS